MPLLYGEGGTKAFQRLQKEILETTSDCSIFAWSPLEEDINLPASCLARYPFDEQMGSVFAPRARRYFALSTSDSSILSFPHVGEIAVTNIGIKIELPVFSVDLRDGLGVQNRYSRRKRLTHLAHVVLFQRSYDYTGFDIGFVAVRHVVNEMDLFIKMCGLPLVSIPGGTVEEQDVRQVYLGRFDPNKQTWLWKVLRSSPINPHQYRAAPSTWSFLDEFR